MESPFLEMMIYGPIFGVIGTLIGFLIRQGATGVYLMMTSGFAVGWIIALLPKQKSDSQTTTQVTHTITEYVNRDYKVDWTPVASNVSHAVEIVAVVLVVMLAIAFILYIADRLERRKLVKAFGGMDPERIELLLRSSPKHMGTLTGPQSKALVVKRETLPAIKPAE